MENMELAFNYMIMAEIAQVVLVIFILLFMKKNHRANIFLAVYIAIISIPFISILLMASGSVSGARLVLCLSIAATSISGALIYFYVNSIAGKLQNFHIRHALHFVPFPFFFLIMLFFLQPGRPDTVHMNLFQILIFCLLILSLVIPTIYIVVSFFVIRRYYHAAESWYSDVERVSMSWLKKIIVLSFMLFVWWDFTFLAGAFYSAKDVRPNMLPHLVFVLAIILITVYHVVRQEEIFKDSRDMNMIFENDQGENEESASQKYAKQSIDEDTLARYRDHLIRYIDESKPYLDEELTIRSLSEKVNIPIHHLSIVINSLFNKNFSAFINEYRIREAQNMLQAEKNEEINILSVAFRAGFSSKSSFNSAFKKITGKTPSEYRLSL